MGCLCFVSCFDEFIESFLHRREIGFVRDVWECLGLVAHNELEWRFSGGLMGADIVDEFCHGYAFCP